MGIAFDSAHGSAKKNNLDYIKLELGKNEFRMIGELLPRYAYWKSLTANGNTFSIPVECLAFNREKEEFDNVEKDWFKHYFQKERPVWSYVIQVLDRNGKVLVCGLKKKLFDQIMTAAATLGDPTDLDTGWWVKLNKKKTGPNVYNIEYELLQLELKKEPLTDEEKAAVAEHLKPIDELFPRQTPEQQKEFIESAWFSKAETNVDNEAIDELSHDEYDSFKSKDSDVTADVPQ